MRTTTASSGGITRPVARRLGKLLRLRQHLLAEADGPDAALAEGLAAALGPAIAAAAERLCVGDVSGT